MLFGRSPSSHIRMGSPQGEQPREISRRRIVKLALSAAALAAVLDKTSSQARAEARVIRIGFQKYGTLILLKGKGLVERALQPLGYEVQWTEFPAGPQLLFDFVGTKASARSQIGLAAAAHATPQFAPLSRSSPVVRLPPDSR